MSKWEYEELEDRICTYHEFVKGVKRLGLYEVEDYLNKLEAENERLKVDVTRQMQIANDAVEEVERLRADQRRLEWLVKNECFVSWLTKDECYVADVAGIMEAPTSSIGWRDAIDKATTLAGVCDE